MEGLGLEIEDDEILTAEEYALQNMQSADMQEIESALIGFAKMHLTLAKKIMIIH